MIESLDSDGDGVIDRATTHSYSVTEQTGKTVWQGTDTTATGTKISETTYEYNLQGRMSKVEIDSDADGVAETTTIYAYDDSGVRVEQAVTEGGTTTTTEYLIDPQNDTGHAKQIEEPGALGWRHGSGGGRRRQTRAERGGGGGGTGVRIGGARRRGIGRNRCSWRGLRRARACPGGGRRGREKGRGRRAA